MWYLLRMSQEDRYCPGCGGPLALRWVHNAERPACSRCGRVIYYGPKLAAAVIVERGGKALMVRRAIEPGVGLWSLPGGYVDRGEALEEAAAREVLEETGVTVEILGLVGAFSERGNPVVLAVYHGRVVSGEAAPGQEVSEVGFFSPGGLPELAFPRDAVALERWLRGGGSQA